MRHTNIVASFLVLIDKNRILLLKRCNTGYHDGDYGLVAGHVEQGETFTNAVIREAKEEAGIVITPKDLQVAHVMHRKSETDQSERVDVYFVARTWKGKVINKEVDKCSEFIWVPVDGLPLNIIDSVRIALQHIFNNIPYSEVGWTDR